MLAELFALVVIFYIYIYIHTHSTYANCSLCVWFGTFGFNARNIAFFIKLYFSIFILWPMGGRRFSLSLNKTLPRVEKRVGCKLWPAFEGQLLNPDAVLSLA